MTYPRSYYLFKTHFNIILHATPSTFKFSA
jgi:hypothetical protein